MLWDEPVASKKENNQGTILISAKERRNDIEREANKSKDRKEEEDTNTVLVLPRNFDRLISTSWTLPVLIYVTSLTQYHIGRERKTNKRSGEKDGSLLLLLLLLSLSSLNPRGQCKRKMLSSRATRMRWFIRSCAMVVRFSEEDEGMSQRNHLQLRREREKIDDHWRFEQGLALYSDKKNQNEKVTKKKKKTSKENERRTKTFKNKSRWIWRITTSRWVENSRHAIINKQKNQCTIDLIMSRMRSSAVVHCSRSADRSLTAMKSENKRMRTFNDHDIHWHTEMLIMTSVKTKRKCFSFFLDREVDRRLTPMGKPGDGLADCKYWAVNASAWKKSNPFPPSKERRTE